MHIVRLPVEIKNLILRPQEIFRIAMAFETPAVPTGKMPVLREGSVFASLLS